MRRRAGAAPPRFGDAIRSSRPDCCKDAIRDGALAAFWPYQPLGTIDIRPPHAEERPARLFDELTRRASERVEKSSRQGARGPQGFASVQPALACSRRRLPVICGPITKRKRGRILGVG